MTGAVEAWLVSVGDNLRIALGVHELVDYCAGVAASRIPRGRAGFDELIFWEGRVVPLLNLASSTDRGDDQAVVVATQRGDDEPVDYLALRVAGEPSRIRVDDSMACEVPGEAQALGLPVLSSFAYDGHAVVVLDSGELISLPADAGPESRTDR